MSAEPSVPERLRALHETLAELIFISDPDPGETVQSLSTRACKIYDTMRPQLDRLMEIMGTAP